MWVWGGGVSSTKFPRRGAAEKSFITAELPEIRDSTLGGGDTQAVGGRGRLARPGSSRSATCKQAGPGRAGLRRPSRPARLRDGDWGAAAPHHPPLPAGGSRRSRPCLSAALLDSLVPPGHTHPLPRSPHPDTALSAAPRAPPTAEEPAPPEVSPHSPTPRHSVPPRQSDATRWKLTRHTSAWQKIKPSWKNQKIDHPSRSQNAVCRAAEPQSPRRPGPRGVAGGVRRGSRRGDGARGWHPPRPGHGRGIRSRGVAGKPRSSSRPEALAARRGGEAAGRALQPGSCGGEIQYHPSGSAARRRVARRAGSRRSAPGASSECGEAGSASEEEEQAVRARRARRAGSLLGRRVGGGDGRGGGRGLGLFLGAFPVLAAAALAPRRWL